MRGACADPAAHIALRPTISLVPRAKRHTCATDALILCTFPPYGGSEQSTFGKVRHYFPSQCLCFFSEATPRGLELVSLQRWQRVMPNPATHAILIRLKAGCGCSRLAFSPPLGGFPPAGSFLQLLAFPWFSALGIWITTDRN